MQKVKVGNDKVFLGRLGDDDCREFAFDISEWMILDGEYSVSCLFVLPSSDDAHAYPIAIDHYRIEGTDLIWIPTNTECSEVGWGKFEAILYNEGQQVATLIWRVQIGKSLAGNETPPEGWENYILAVEKLVDEIENMTVSASVDANVGTPSVEVTTSGGQGEPFSISLAFHNLKGETGGQGEQGVGIASISIAEKSTSGLNVTYTLTATKTDGTTTASDFVVTNGNGIASAELNDDYTLTLYFDDGTSYTTPSIRGEQGEQGEQGIQGVGVSTITATKTSTVGLVDTYDMVITLTNGDTQTVTFTVTNGSNVELSDDDPLMDGTADSGTDTEASRSDHVHPHDVSLLPTDSVNGNPISISDGFPVNAKGLSVSLVPVQDLHGQSSPYPAGGGKNKLSYPYGFVTETTNGCTATIQSDGSVTFSGTPSADATWNIKKRTDTSGNYSLFLDEGEYIINGCPAGGSATTYQISVISNDGTTIGRDRGSGATFTIPSGGMNIGVQLFVYGGYNPNSVIMKPMIRLSSVADGAFAPYSNICPISGHSEVSVVRSGKNLLSPSAYGIDGTTSIAKVKGTLSVEDDIYTFTPTGNNEDAYFGTIGFSFPLSPNYYNSMILVEIEPNKDYTVSLTNSAFIKNYIQCFDAEWNNALIGGSTSKNFATSTYTFTSPANAKLMTIRLGLTNGVEGQPYSTKIQIAQESTPTPYVPPNILSITIPLGQTVYGGTVDVTEGKVTITHTMSQIASVLNIDSDSTGYFWYTTRGTVDIPMIKGLNADLISNRLRAVSNVAKTGPEGTIAFYANGIIRWKEQGGLSLADYRTYIASNPLQISYELATPIELTLTPTQLMMLLGDNVISSVEADTIYLDYYCDVTRYIAKKVAELQALILEG